MVSETTSVVVVGVAGLSAALFMTQAGLATTVVSTGESIPLHNAHLENYPGPGRPQPPAPAGPAGRTGRRRLRRRGLVVWRDLFSGLDVEFVGHDSMTADGLYTAGRPAENTTIPSPRATAPRLVSPSSRTAARSSTTTGPSRRAISRNGAVRCPRAVRRQTTRNASDGKPSRWSRRRPSTRHTPTNPRCTRASSTRSNASRGPTPTPSERSSAR